MSTIVALATPLGRSGIGVIRLSGEAALQIARTLTADPAFDPEPRVAYLKQLRDVASSDIIDEALVTFFPSPHSFTGEDVIEFSCHGSPVLLRQVIDHSLALGARVAEPGEFSLRALSNGQMNLAQAEAIRDLIDAQTRMAARQAMRQMRGEFSNQLQPIKDDLLNVIVVLESALEFVEDDLPAAQSEDIRSRLLLLSAAIEKIASTFKAGHLIREGIRLAIVGRPNVGKSSLFNALIGSDRAIVTEVAGTTRDQLHEKFSINNIPISLIDTAGLRETTDMVESIGVERSRRSMADADLVIAMLDVSEIETNEDIEILKSVETVEHIIVLNKTDKTVADKIDEFVANLKRQLPVSPAAIVRLSAKTGDGLDSLKRSIIEPYSPSELGSNGFLVSDARHHDLLLRANSEIENSVELHKSGASEEVVLVGLHNALRYLGQITGETTSEDMLTRIFATFCIGK